ncbi:hypothetical protein Q31b_42400 [Novipirellula aureliae]|uniref:Uncharacterized protein n=1 Tax=Novipirellula aureliae TaxID=2527966 RepID=A0A5C6DSC4_9BACT|nr:hypothetical protein [Novipirellula aureliae]TWU39155.1 hypothetical protein Q31b_42400 [Novipirellula aureliae]
MHRYPGETTRMKSAEVDALMRLHGWSFDDACQLVALHPHHYAAGETPLQWLPTPTDIERSTLQMQAGEINCGRNSQKPWETLDNGLTDEDNFATAGKLPDDVCQSPSWLCLDGTCLGTDNDFILVEDCEDS